MSKKSKYLGEWLWRLDNSYDAIVVEKSKYVITQSGSKVLKTNINFQPMTGLPVELGEWQKPPGHKEF